MNIMRSLAHKHNTGFTLVEMLVGIAIFMIVVTTTLGAFLTMVDINKKVQSVRNAMDNANLAMETMMRNIRLGYDYTSCQSPVCIEFTDQNGQRVRYFLDTTSAGQNNGDPVGVLYRVVNSQSPVAITSPDVDIDTLRFDISGSSSVTDAIQAHVRIFVSGKTILPRNQHNFDFAFQSLATQRLYDK